MTMGNQGQSNPGEHGPDPGPADYSTRGFSGGPTMQPPSYPTQGYGGYDAGGAPLPGAQQGWPPPGSYPVPGGPLQATSQDHDHLRALSIAFYIYAGLHAVGVLLGLLYLFVGTALVGSVSIAARNALPAILAGSIAVALLVVLLVAGLFCYLYYLAGRSLTEHTRYPLILVMAGLACLNFPLGTTLGVCTFIVVMRPSVKSLFGQR